MKSTSKRKPSKTSSPKKDGSHLKTAIIVGAGLTATGVLGYFDYQYYKKLKEQEAKRVTPTSTFTPPSNDTVPSYQPPPTYNEPSNTKHSGGQSEPVKSKSYTDYSNNKSDTPTWTTPKPPTEFPLKKGSKGANVRALQDALISTYGKTILPKYGSDGDFGKELVAALKKLKYPATISESLFHVITGGNATQSSMALQFYSALNKNDYTATMTLLQKLKTKADYTTVSNEFLKYRLHGGVRQTLVNGTLNTFSDKEQKQNIRLEFIRMGLKYNGKKWSLDGIGGAKIITTVPTQIWLDGFNSMQVPQNMILGLAMAERLDFTLFENNNRYFLVKTNDIKKI